MSELTMLYDKIYDFRNGKITESEINDYLWANRKLIFDKAELISEDSFKERLKYMSNHWNVTCSCGSRNDSCVEDGNGYYSRFYFADDNIFRIKIKK